MQKNWIVEKKMLSLDMPRKSSLGISNISRDKPNGTQGGVLLFVLLLSAEDCKQVCWAIREFTRLFR